MKKTKAKAKSKPKTKAKKAVAKGKPSTGKKVKDSEELDQIWDEDLCE